MQNDWGLHKSYSCLESQFVTPPVITGETYFIMFLYIFSEETNILTNCRIFTKKKEKKKLIVGSFSQKTNCRIVK